MWNVGWRFGHRAFCHVPLSRTVISDALVLMWVAWVGHCPASAILSPYRWAADKSTRSYRPGDNRSKVRLGMAFREGRAEIPGPLNKFLRMGRKTGAVTTLRTILKSRARSADGATAILRQSSIWAQQVARDPVSGTDSIGVVSGPDPDSKSFPHQTATVGLEWAGFGDPYERGILFCGRPTAACQKTGIDSGSQRGP